MSLLAWVDLIIVFGFPFLFLGLGILSTVEVLGKSWHRPHLYTRALGAIGLLATTLIGLQWLAVTAFYALEFLQGALIIS